jgi:adenylate cyclase
LLVIWSNGCIGLHLWLQFKTSFRRHIAHLCSLALLVPALSIAGFTAVGVDIVRLSSSQRWINKTVSEINLSPQADIECVLLNIGKVGYGYLALVVLLFVARQIRLSIRWTRRGMMIQYNDGQEVIVIP